MRILLKAFFLCLFIMTISVMTTHIHSDDDQHDPCNQSCALCFFSAKVKKEWTIVPTQSFELSALRFIQSIIFVSSQELKENPSYFLTSARAPPQLF